MKDLKQRFSPVGQVKMNANDKAEVLHNLLQRMRTAPTRSTAKLYRVRKTVGTVAAAAAAVAAVGFFGVSEGHLFHGNRVNPSLASTTVQPVSMKALSNIAIDHGIAVQITDVFYDTHQLKFRYTIRVPKGYEPLEFNGHSVAQVSFRPQDMTIDGQTVEASAENADKWASDGSYTGDCALVLESSNLPSTGTLHVSLYKVGTVNGKWAFELPISTTGQEQVLTPNVSKTYDGATLTVQKIELGPQSTVIDYSLSEVMDAKGNVKYNPQNFDRVSVFDGAHKWLTPVGGGLQGSPEVDGNVKTFHYTIICQSERTKPSALQIEPSYIVFHPYSREKLEFPVTGKFPITIHSVVGTTIINNIQFLHDKTMVKVTLDPSTLEHPDFYFEDGKGRVYREIRSLPDGTMEYPAMDNTQIIKVVHQDPQDNTSGVGISQPIPELNIQVPLN